MTAPTLPHNPNPDSEPEPEPAGGEVEVPAGRRRRRLGVDRLGGGRWRVWVTRLLVWTVLALAALGALQLLIAPSVGQVVNQALDTRLAGGDGVAEWQAAALAERAVRDYLTYDPETTGGSGRLGRHLADEVSVAGWAGDQPVRAHHVSAAAVAHPDEGQVTVTVAALVAIGDQPPAWHHLAVPVAADAAGRLAVAGSPTLTAAPAQPDLAGRPPGDVDGQLTEALTGPVTEFLAAYARGGQATVDAFTTDDAQLAALPGRGQLAEVTDFAVHQGRGGQRTATATVRWQLADGGDDAEATTVTQTYRLALSRTDGRWLIADLAPNPDVSPR